MEMRALLNRLANLEKQTLNEGAKPDFLDMDKDGNKKEPMKKAVADKKKPESNKAKKERLGGIAEALMKEMGYDLYERVTPDGKGGYTGRLIPQPGDSDYVPPATGPAPGTVGTGSGGQLVSGDGTPVNQGASPPPAKPKVTPASALAAAKAPATSLSADAPNPEAELDSTIATTRANQAPEVPAYMPGNSSSAPAAAPAAPAAPAAKPGVDTGMTDRNPYDDDALAQQRLDAHQAQQTKYSAQGTPAPAPAPAAVDQATVPASANASSSYTGASKPPAAAPAPAPAPGKVPNEFEIAQSQGQDPGNPNAKPNTAPTAPLQLPPGAKPSAGEKAAGITVAGAAPNRDSMPFNKAFADAKAKGEKQFTWKGKPYAVKMAEDAELTAMLRIAGLR